MHILKLLKKFFQKIGAKVTHILFLSTGDKWISPVVNTFNTFI